MDTLQQFNVTLALFLWPESQNEAPAFPHQSQDVTVRVTLGERSDRLT